MARLFQGHHTLDGAPLAIEPVAIEPVAIDLGLDGVHVVRLIERSILTAENCAATATVAAVAPRNHMAWCLHGGKVVYCVLASRVCVDEHSRWDRRSCQFTQFLQSSNQDSAPGNSATKINYTT